MKRAHSTDPSSNELRVFISSTFRDLQEEREHLVKKIFPEIRALCRERGVTFTDVDLRWGLTEEEATLGRVIRTCLEEVDKCRPYFIGMIGDRYGWVPELHDIMIDPDLLTKYPFVEDLTIDGASVTEMEFIHGAFEAPDPTGQSSFFYRRNRVETSEPDDNENLSRLIERIRAGNFPLREFSDIEDLGSMVRDDLIALIHEHWPESEVPSPLELERRSHAAFAASRVRAYIPIAAHLKTFNSWFKDGESPLILHGRSGLGKSSLVAYLASTYRRKNPDAWIIEHYVGASDGGGSAVSVMHHVIAEICERFDIDEKIPESLDALTLSFANWLFRAEGLASEQNSTLLLAIDAVNQLGPEGRGMTWLPETIPSGVKLLVSTTPGDSEDKLRDREWGELEILPLEDLRIRQSIVVRYLGEFHKGISPEQLHRVVGDQKGSSPLFLRVIAEELRLHGEHERLDEVIDRFSQADSMHNVFDLVLARMERDFGPPEVRSLLSLIAASRAGLSENELLELMAISRLELSRLLFALDFHLLRRDGLLGFFHAYLHHSVENRYLPEDATRQKVHSRLADYFASSPPSFRTSRELFYQLHCAGDRRRLASALATLQLIVVVYNRETEYEVLSYWAELAEEFPMEAEYRNALQLQSEDDPARSLRELDIVSQLMGSTGRIHAAMEFDVKRIQLAERLNDQSQVADALNRIGWHHYRDGNYDDAFRELNRALRIFRDLDDVVEATNTLGGIGSVHRSRGEFKEALACFGEQESKWRELGNRSNLFRALGNTGLVYSNQGENGRALEYFRRCEKLCNEIGDRIGLMSVMNSIGTVLIELGEYDQAQVACESQKEIAREVGNLRMLSSALGNLGGVHYYRGEYDATLDCLRQQEEIAVELGDQMAIASVNGNIGAVLAMQNIFDEALERLYKALDEVRRVGARVLLTEWLDGIGEILIDIATTAEEMPEYIPGYVHDARPDNWRDQTLQVARNLVNESVEISREFSKPDTDFSGRLHLARITAAEGRPEQAVATLLEELKDTTEAQDLANLHFWIWKLASAGTPEVDRDAHRREALELYQRLAAESQIAGYNNKIKELSSAEVRA